MRDLEPTVVVVPNGGDAEDLHFVLVIVGRHEDVALRHARRVHHVPGSLRAAEATTFIPSRVGPPPTNILLHALSAGLRRNGSLKAANATWTHGPHGNEPFPHTSAPSVHEQGGRVRRDSEMACCTLLQSRLQRGSPHELDLVIGRPALGEHRAEHRAVCVVG
jgi:hypothetical protein